MGFFFQTEESLTALQLQREVSNEVLEGFLEEQRRLNREIHKAVWHERLDERQFGNTCNCMAYIVWRCIRVTFERMLSINPALEELESTAEENQEYIRLAEQERCLLPSGDRSLHQLEVCFNILNLKFNPYANGFDSFCTGERTVYL